MTADAKPSNAVPVQDDTRLSTIDALLLVFGPLFTPLLLILLGWLAWKAGPLFGNYVATAHPPATPVAWWQWPWGWPGARLVEALCSLLGLPAVADFPASNLLMFTDPTMTARVFLATFANCSVALMPLYLSLLLIGPAARAYRWTRAMKPP